MAIRLLINALPSLQSHWHPLLASMAILSFALGNLVAIVQTNLKRMLAYSAIAHMGYALLGFVAGSAFGYAMALFYMLIYGLMALGAFALLIVVSQPGKPIEEVNDFTRVECTKSLVSIFNAPNYVQAFHRWLAFSLKWVSSKL